MNPTAAERLDQVKGWGLRLCGLGFQGLGFGGFGFEGLEFGACGLGFWSVRFEGFGVQGLGFKFWHLTVVGSLGWDHDSEHYCTMRFYADSVTNFHVTLCRLRMLGQNLYWSSRHRW